MWYGVWCIQRPFFDSLKKSKEFHYVPQQTKTLSVETKANVTVEYYIQGTEQKLQNDFRDTIDQLISTETTTYNYYELDGVEHEIANTRNVVTTPTNYRYEITAEEAPEIITINNQQYKKVRVVGEENGVLKGDTEIVYYYTLVPEVPKKTEVPSIVKPPVKTSDTTNATIGLVGMIGSLLALFRLRKKK